MILVVFRLAAHITVPGVNSAALAMLFQQNDLLGVFSALTGGSMESFSIILMGLSPYINASIILQLMTVVVPRLEALSKEGQEGRRKINQYTRWLTLPLAFLQSYGMIALLNQGAGSAPGGQLIQNASDPLVILPIMIIVTAGTLFLMWLGELITEKGIGNGVSLLIFASIVSGMPAVFGRMLNLAKEGDSSMFFYFAAFVALIIAMLVFVVLVTEAQRNIPITYANRSPGARGEKASLPIRLNQAGMIPIIFAISLMTFPSILAQFFGASASPALRSIAEFILLHLDASNPSYLYILSYFVLIVLFSFFYVSVTFNPEQIAESIQKRGGFIPGVRPGSQTSEFLAKVSGHLNLFGGLFLAVVAITPMIFTKYTPLSPNDTIIGGSGLIIVVGVILELIRQINAQLAMHDYDKFY